MFILDLGNSGLTKVHLIASSGAHNYQMVFISRWSVPCCHGDGSAMLSQLISRLTENKSSSLVSKFSKVIFKEKMCHCVKNCHSPISKTIKLPHKKEEDILYFHLLNFDDSLLLYDLYLCKSSL